MHTLQWIAIKDESAEDAFTHVRNNLEAYMGDEYSSAMWYDWFVTGGGRWNPNPDSQYSDDDKSMVLCSDTDVEAIKAKVSNSMKQRIQEFTSYRQGFESKELDLNEALNKFDGTIDFSFQLYELGKMIDMLQGTWDFNSYFFDMEHHTTNPKYFLNRLDYGEKNWYLIPVDFHF
jgi:hypothetical protein